MFQMNEPKDVAESVGLSIIGEHLLLKLCLPAPSPCGHTLVLTVLSIIIMFGAAVCLLHVNWLFSNSGC